MLRFEELPALIGGKLLQLHQEYFVQHLLTDSRKLTQPGSSVFFAIKGLYNDGHSYIFNLYERGVRQFIIEDNLFLSGLKSEKSLL